MSKFWAPARMVFVTVSSTNAFIPVQSTKFNQVASARLCFLIDLEITEKTENMNITIRSIIILLLWSSFYIYIAKCWRSIIIIAETDNIILFVMLQKLSIVGYNCLNAMHPFSIGKVYFLKNLWCCIIGKRNLKITDTKFSFFMVRLKYIEIKQYG